MSVTRRHLRLVKSSPSVMARFKKLPDLAALEFVYASYSEKMADASPTSYIYPIPGTIEHERFREVIGRQTATR